MEYLIYLAVTIGFIIAFHLPYGERTPYWLKFLVACCFTAPTLFLGFTAWQIIVPIAFIGMFALSNWKPTSNIFPWKIVEFLTGTIIGIAVAVFLKNEWAIIGALASGGTLFAIGGTGFKWVRRFVLPIVFGVLILLFHK